MPSVARSVGQTRLIRFQDFTVAPSTTEDEVILPVTSFRSQKLFVEVQESVTSATKVFTANVAKIAVSGPDDTLFGKVGDDLDFTFNVLTVGSDVVMRVTNNEANTLTVSVIRITF